MINGQGTGDIAGLRYGLFPMSFNGCEVIAVYNALEYLGIGRDICEVRDYMQRYAVLFGLFGGNIYRLDKVLHYFGAVCEKSVSADGAESFIISSWTGTPFLSAIHTVFCISQNDCIKVYNRYNNVTSVRIYESCSGIFGGRKPLVIYNIREK